MKIRTLWISDVHLGAVECMHAPLLEFLRQHDPERLYLVGDILDIRRVRRKGRWDPAQHELFSRLLAMATDRRTTYVWGNHDPEVQLLGPHPHDMVDVMRTAVHRLADGRRALILHGDQVDSEIRVGVSHGRIRQVSRLYYRLLAMDILVRRLLRNWMPAPPSLVSLLKARLAAWNDYILRYETAVARIAREAGADVAVAGHIHVPRMRRIGPVLYVNCGDWVEHGTALREKSDGTLQLVRWNGTVLDECRRHDP